MKTVRRCELCDGDAAVCCPSDSAFLCWSCDAKVHQANFLVARHIRNVVCWNCNSFTGKNVSGFRVAPIAGLCPGCSSPENDAVSSSSSSSSSSSACVSSTHSSGRKRSPVPSRADPAAEGVLEKWCQRLGIGGEGKVVRKACDALRLCTALPFRAALAACLLFSLRGCSDQSSSSTWRAVKKLEEISGVPARLILAAELKLRQRMEKAGKQRRCHWMDEGWDECSA